MKRNAKIRMGKKTACLALTLCLIATMFPASVSADEPNEVTWDNQVVAQNGETVEQVYDDINSENGALLVSAAESSTANVTVNGNVTGGKSGICVETTGDGASANLTMNGSVTMPAHGGWAIGVNADRDDQTSIHVTTGDIIGSCVSVDASKNTDVVTGDITNENGPAVLFSAYNAPSYDDPVALLTTGSIYSVSENSIYSSDNSNAAVNMRGDVTVKFPDPSNKESPENRETYGINILQVGFASITAGFGNMTVTNGNALGVTNSTTNANITVNGGSIDVTGGRGISITGSERNNICVNTGDVKSDQTAVFLNDLGGSIVNINTGDITSAGSGLFARGIDVTNSKQVDNEINLNVNGSIKTGEYGGAAMNLEQGGSYCVNGDVTAEGDSAIYIDPNNRDADIFISGTLDSAGNGIELTKKEDGFHTQLTVWKLKYGKDHVAFGGDDTDGTFAKSVNYIVEIEQPVAGAVISAVKEDGSPLDTSHDREVVHEGDKICFNVDLSSGISLIGIYNGKGKDKEELKKDDTGYYLIAEEGGGIHITVELGGSDYWKFDRFKWYGSKKDGYENAEAVFLSKVTEGDSLVSNAGLDEKIVKPTCTKGGYTEYYAAITAEQSLDGMAHEEIKKGRLTEKTGHNWGKWKVIKKATALETGLKQRVCKNDPSHIQEKEIPAKGVSGTALVRMTAKKKTNLVIHWTKITNAEGYDVFFAKCSKDESGTPCRLIKTIPGNRTFTYTKTGLKENVSYKAFVKAWAIKDGKKVYVKTSPEVHAYTSGGNKKYTNPKSVSVNAENVTLKKGKTFDIKASVNKLDQKKTLMSKSHGKQIRYKSSDKSVAKVSSRGMITAVGKGSCTIYVYAINGVRKAIEVTV